jgi:hypothetical protein
MRGWRGWEELPSIQSNISLSEGRKNREDREKRRGEAEKL